MAKITLGRNERLEFVADCLATDVVGDCVYFRSDVVLEVPQVTKVDVTDPAKMPAVGVIKQKLSATRCLVVTHGVMPFAATVQAVYYVGAAGQPSLARPPYPALLQEIAVGRGTATLHVNPSRVFSRSGETVFGAFFLGAKNGMNLAFTTPSSFIQDSLRVYFNGVRILETHDFTSSESGGPGSGYDTITMLAAPRTTDHLIADYTPHA